MKRSEQNWPHSGVNAAAREIVNKLDEQGCDCNVERQCECCRIVADGIRRAVAKAVRRAKGKTVGWCAVNAVATQVVEPTIWRKKPKGYKGIIGGRLARVVLDTPKNRRKK